jgi:hypothetical protein
VASQPVLNSDKRFSGQHDIVSWAYDLIAEINKQAKGKWHIPANATTVGILVAWANVESSGYRPSSPGGRNNPLNTTETSQGGVAGKGGTQGNIVDFATYADGIKNQAHNLLSPSFGYPKILAGLQAASPAKTFAAIDASAFGTHFGKGAKPAPVSGGGATPGGIGSGSGNTANTVSAVSDAAGQAIQGVVGLVPGLGTALSAGEAVVALDKVIIGIFSNWRYVVEVLVGASMIGIGILLIAHDTGALKAATDRTQKVAATAAVAA